MPNDNEEPIYQSFNMRDYERGGSEGLTLIDISYLQEMFDLEVENEQGKPIRIALTEKGDSFTNRPTP